MLMKNLRQKHVFILKYETLKGKPHFSSVARNYHNQVFKNSCYVIQLGGAPYDGSGTSA